MKFSETWLSNAFMSSGKNSAKVSIMIALELYLTPIFLDLSLNTFQNWKAAGLSF
jgi:hypothetical protein